MVSTVLSIIAIVLATLSITINTYRMGYEAGMAHASKDTDKEGTGSDS